jgi:hypothetical protein
MYQGVSVNMALSATGAIMGLYCSTPIDDLAVPPPPPSFPSLATMLPKRLISDVKVRMLVF